MKLISGMLRALWTVYYSAASSCPALRGRREASVVTLERLGEARFGLTLCLSRVGLISRSQRADGTVHCIDRHIIVCVRKGRLKQASVR
jgi:hypothetical protein